MRFPRPPASTQVSPAPTGSRLCETTLWGTEELAAGIQFVVDGRGQGTSVVLSRDVWKKLVSQIEDAEDRAVLSRLAPRLAEGPKAALAWSEVENEWA